MSGRAPPGAVLLGGDPADPAITIDGATISYRRLEALTRQVEPGPGPLTVGYGSVVDTLVSILGAVRTGRPVVVAAPGSRPTLGELPDATFLVVVTSGSSDHPRTLARSLSSWTDSFAPLAALAGLTATDRVLLSGPLHSTLYLFAALHTLWLGAQLTDQAQDATAVHCVPMMLAALLDELPDRGVLRTAVVAGSALPASLAVRAAARGIAVLEYYGAAELSFVAARRPPVAFRPFPGVELRETDGLLWARSAYLALGYVGAGQDRPGPLRVDDEGYATVGDLGELGSDGSLRVFGRADAAITTGGATVVAEDVEAVLSNVAGVRAAAAIGLPHPRLGQLLTAVVELDPGTDLASVRASTRSRLTGAGRPRRWLVRRDLPRTPGGKIARARLLAELAAEAVAAAEPAAPPAPAAAAPAPAWAAGSADAGPVPELT